VYAIFLMMHHLVHQGMGRPYIGSFLDDNNAVNVVGHYDEYVIINKPKLVW